MLLAYLSQPRQTAKNSGELGVDQLAEIVD
jgi:hypothetical protein